MNFSLFVGGLIVWELLSEGLSRFLGHETGFTHIVSFLFLLLLALAWFTLPISSIVC